MTATAGRRKCDRRLERPDDGGSPITSYTVTPYIGATPQTSDDHHRLAAGDEHHDHGLTNGTAYTFTVTATNAIGTGPASTP